ncbi:sigma-70 family RNA polymerase sigma factor [Anaerococcus vaginalis]|uniref:sigma-70 family RNA polymerase sigma factor n=1 Tax=Anaerococcus vaginalis TaxID=33037 RepID=UPI00290C7C87|nr:sigma-70 family RNA polymerase sigma factor [Anaerococcus vaginalis]MDU6547613.1 sigma-70 family RNA polymerase sigma factor [Anaerococcus vaginalis]
MDNTKAYDNNLKLFYEYQKNKDINIRNTIALNNSGLIYLGLKGIYNHEINEYEELYQEGFIALLNAVERFEPNKGFNFSTYAIKYIKSASRKRLNYNTFDSLDEPLKTKKEDARTRLDLIKDTKIDIERDTISKEFNNNLKKILTYDEMKVIKNYYLYNKTLKEISEMLGITYNQVTGLRSKAERKIYNSKYFKDYQTEAVYYDETTYLKAYDYSRPKYSKTNKVKETVFNTVWEIDKRDNNIKKDFIREFL